MRVFLIVIYFIHSAISQVSIFKPHNYDSSGFVPIFVKPIERTDFSRVQQPKIIRQPDRNARMDNIQKLVNPFQYEQKPSNNQKLQNPMEFSTTKVIARPLPKYVTEAKQKFVFGDDDHEMMEATETKINPFSFPISRRYFSFPTSASLGKRQDYVVFTQKNKYTNSLPAENQIILPTPVTKVRSIWPVLSNDKVKVKIRPLNKIVAHRGSETFEITSPSPPTTTKTTTTTKPPQIDNSKKSKNNYEKTKNKLENLNDIKALPLISSSKVAKVVTKAPESMDMGQSIYHKQLMKFRKLLNPSELQTTLMLRTLPKLMLINLESLDDLPRMGQALKQELHQEDLFVFHATLVQLQKILSEMQGNLPHDIKPLYKRTLEHNMSLIKMLFNLIVKSEKMPGKRIKVKNSNEFLKHYRPLKEIFSFL